MTEDHPLGDEKNGTPGWAVYLTVTALTFSASMVGGCINRQEARRENRQAHEQILGKVEELRQEVIRRRDNR